MATMGLIRGTVLRAAATVAITGVLVLPSVTRADSRYAPDASSEALAALQMRCHLSVTCPLGRKDYALFRRAMSGDREAEFQMGGKLERGEGMPTDRDAAVSWYGRAAEGGHVRAALELNRLRREGAATHADDAKIAASLRRAANAGDANATRALSEMSLYRQGASRTVR